MLLNNLNRDMFKQFCSHRGSQHPSPNVKNALRIRAANLLEIITFVMPKVLVFKAPRRHVQKQLLAFFAKIWPKKITSRDGRVLLIIEACSVEFLVVCLRMSTGFIGDFFRERHL